MIVVDAAVAADDLIATRGETWELRMTDNCAIQSAVAPTKRRERTRETRVEEEENVTLSAQETRRFANWRPPLLAKHRQIQIEARAREKR